MLLFGGIAALILVFFQLSRYSMFMDYGSVEWLLFAGAVGFLGLGYWISRSRQQNIPVKDASHKELETGQLRDYRELGISQREYEVLQGIAEGLSNGEIAKRLFISENTIKTHASKLFSKLGA